jgi:hypothetical protein
MKSETITRRTDLIIRRHILEPGETLPWHTDPCHRFTVVVSGEANSIEYRDSAEVETFPVHPGLAGWTSHSRTQDRYAPCAVLGAGSINNPRRGRRGEQSYEGILA